MVELCGNTLQCNLIIYMNLVLLPLDLRKSKNCMTEKFVKFLPVVIIVLVFLASITLIYKNDVSYEHAATSVAGALEKKNIFTIYNIETDSNLVFKSQVKSGQLISDILQPFGITNNQIHAIAEKKDVLDVSKIKTGNSYCIITNNSGEVIYFVYEKNKIEYAVFKFGGSEISAYSEKKVVEKRLRSVGGVIEGSVYETLVAHEADPALAYALAEIFAYNLDFYKVNKGDIFKLYFSELYVDGEYAGIDTVYAAHMDHRQKDFYAFLYTQDGVSSYFDETGKSVKKAFLQAPLKYSRISSKYSKNRFHPVQKRYKPHLGTDYAAPAGTPIYTVGDGVVIEKGFTSGNGNYVKIKHNETYTTQYLHMSKFAKGLQKGDRVTQGEVIGYVGSTGLATGPHLCYRFWKNGVQVDPFQEKIPPSYPVKEVLMDSFRTEAGKMMRILEKTPTDVLPTHAEVINYMVMLDSLGVLHVVQMLVPSTYSIES